MRPEMRWAIFITLKNRKKAAHPELPSTHTMSPQRLDCMLRLTALFLLEELRVKSLNKRQVDYHVQHN